jgi:NTP pyrophosphatase (non-canonical NTP hydrolase)
MSELNQLIDLVRKFRDERDWAQFHNAKDLAAGLSIEAAELLEQFLWKQPKEADPAKVQAELADVLIFALLLAHEQKIDLTQAITQKLAENAAKYPVEKAKGRATKYDEL